MQVNGDSLLLQVKNGEKHIFRFLLLWKNVLFYLHKEGVAVHLHKEGVLNIFQIIKQLFF